MKKKILSFLLLAVICTVTVLPISAADGGFADEYYRLGDGADLLSDTEESALLSKLDEISVRQSMDVVIITTDSIGDKSPMEYADDIYDECNFGYGSSRDGLLLLISMENSDWYISTCGYGIYAFTDAGIQYVGNEIKGDLSSGSYYSAFVRFIDLCDDFITQAKTGEPYDRSSLPKEPLSLIWIPVSAVIGFVIALIAVGSMKSKLKTVRFQPAANSYVKPGSMVISQNSDLFLYNTVTKTARPKDNDSGSSTHTSSSGTTHGGGGGKF